MHERRVGWREVTLVGGGESARGCPVPARRRAAKAVFAVFGGPAFLEIPKLLPLSALMRAGRRWRRQACYMLADRGVGRVFRLDKRDPDAVPDKSGRPGRLTHKFDAPQPAPSSPTRFSHPAQPAPDQSARVRAMARSGPSPKRPPAGGEAVGRTSSSP